MGKSIDIHADLIARCRANEPRAQAEIYQLYSKAMFHVSYRIVGTREDAEDILQESFVKAFQKMVDFRAESSFGAWLKRIVVNQSLNSIRSKVYFKEISDEEIQLEEEEDEKEEPEWEVADVKQAMRQMPEGYRTVFSLYMFEDYTHREIAELLGVGEGTSKSQLNRAKRHLKELLIRMSDERRQA